MNEPTFEWMRYMVRRVYSIGESRNMPNSSTALKLLRVVGQRLGCNVNVQIDGSANPGEYLYKVWIGDKECQDSLPVYHAATLGEAAIRCAYHAIPEGER